MLDKFIEKRMSLLPEGGRGEVDVCCAYLRIPKSLLETPIPAEATQLIYGEERAVTLEEFALNVIHLEDDAIISLSANHSIDGKSRTWWTTVEDVTLWLQFLAPFGYTVEDLLTQAEVMEIVKEEEL